MTLIQQVLNLILGLSITVIVIGGLMFFAIKASDYLNKKDGQNKH
jgi:hypothetical protein